ncbi:hypothetical protein BDW59DRAFT_167072 [Aspergillus cavernicola]|uniref:Uncharacterized protein n=1 Tax=Aspergillus cavernicola TaxID=176166 RepID=A0ABR4HH09_9EURO
MAFPPSSDGCKYTAKSSMPLLFDVNIGLVVDDVLDTSILQDKFTQLTGSSLLLGGVMRSKRDTRKFSPGSTVDFKARNLEYNLRSFLPFSWKGTGMPTVLHDLIVFLRCPLSERQVQRESNAKVAERIRLATIAYKYPAVVKCEVRFIENQVLAPSLPQLHGRAKSFSLVSPWTTFNFAGLDFSGTSRQGRNPSVVFVNPDVNVNSGTLLSPLLVTLKDGSGGYWLRGGNTAAGWEDFDHCTSMEMLFPCDLMRLKSREHKVA